MNKLSTEKRERVIAALVEGNSIRSTERMTDVHRDTIMRLSVAVGTACGRFLDEEVRYLTCERIQMDEIWCFVGKKQGHLKDTDNPERLGHFWTYVAMCADTKLIAAYSVGKQNLEVAQDFIKDLSQRIHGRVQLSSDSTNLYLKAVRRYFGRRADYGRVVKSYIAEPIGPGRYSPPHVASVATETVYGAPQPEHISTSYVERQNLGMRMNMRRFTRLTNGFSRKPENLRAAVSLHFFVHNYVKIHGSIRTTPAMASGITRKLWTIRDAVDLAEANQS